jgi:hypothetical protein
MSNAAIRAFFIIVTSFSWVVKYSLLALQRTLSRRSRLIIGGFAVASLVERCYTVSVGKNGRGAEGDIYPAPILAETSGEGENHPVFPVLLLSPVGIRCRDGFPSVRRPSDPKTRFALIDAESALFFTVLSLMFATAMPSYKTLFLLIKSGAFPGGQY